RLETYGQNATDYPGLVTDVGRVFLGMDLGCAQCHDHLFIDDYKQVDFQGLYGFFKQVSIRGGAGFPAVNEGLTKEKIEFISVFVQEPKMTGPRLPGGEEIAIPMFEKGQEYEQPPDPKTKSPGILKFRPLKVLAEKLPAHDNAAFARNSANRFWFLMMGRGLVEPLDQHHSDNPPSHPELLDLLAAEFAAKSFDVKWLLRELMLSETYQRSTLAPEGADPETIPAESYRVALERRLSAEQLLEAMLIATGNRSRLAGDPAAESKELTALRELFVKHFGNAPKEPEERFAPSLESALFVMNNDAVLSLVQPKEGNLVDRLSKQPDPKQIAEELYLAILTRLPTDEERTEVESHLAAGSTDRTKALAQLAWALLASTEFCVQH
ncbi:MAG: DUF1549 and DUF1553 domain-containing protein, partial [Planctomycetes bacterium]|nr:DUF1549 and DUF1553 domain-containing protein [Planctomycetota bacterium]